MTEQEKIEQGFCTARTDAITGEVTIIPYSDEEVARVLAEAANE